MFNTVIWIYVALLIIGGLMGFIKGKSKISLISSTISAIILALVALGEIARHTSLKSSLDLLLVIMGARFHAHQKDHACGHDDRSSH